MKSVFCLLSILFVISLSLVAQNDGLKDLEDLRDKQNALLEYSEEDMVEIPGKDIVMAPPEYFEYNDSIGGFFHPGSSTSIQILEIQNASMSDATESLNQTYFETQGFHLKKDSVLTLNNGNSAKIYITDYTVNNEAYERIFFFTGHDKTIWVNVNYPAIVKDLVYKPVMSSLKTVKPN